MVDTEQVTVIVKNLNGKTLREYSGHVIDRNVDMVQVETHYDGDAHDLGDAEVKPGDRLVIRFFDNRMYNVVHIFDSDTNAFGGWYCNFMRPAHLNGETVAAEDLALGLYVDPDEMQTLVVNRDEFEELGLSQREHDDVEEALARLKMAAAESTPPFGNQEPIRRPADRSMPGPSENIAKDPKRNIDLNNPRTDQRRTTED